MLENLNLGTDLLFGYRDIASLILILISSFIFILIFKFTKNYWALSSNMNNIIFILPIVSFVITKVIAGNIALSLGMVGALSIVRFRHPVRSPFELVIYFSLISLGISYGVSLKWGTILTIIVNIIIIINYFKQSLLTNEFESINYATIKPNLEIESANEIDILEKSEYLRSSYNNKIENKFIYKLEFENRNQLIEFDKKLKNEKEILGTTKNF